MSDLQIHILLQVYLALRRGDAPPSYDRMAVSWGAETLVKHTERATHVVTGRKVGVAASKLIKAGLLARQTWNGRNLYLTPLGRDALTGELANAHAA